MLLNINIIKYFLMLQKDICSFLKNRARRIHFKCHLFFIIVVLSRTSFGENIFIDVPLKFLCWLDVVVCAYSPRIQQTNAKGL